MADEIQDIRESKKVEKLCYEKSIEKSPVTFDNICKEVILRNQIFRRNWPARYEHLTGDFFNKVLAEERRKAGLPVDTFKHKTLEDSVKGPPIDIKPSAVIPRTSSGMVGLRSSRPECNLEFMGRWYTSPKWTIEPPIESGEFRVTKQKYIFLG